jgi:hypothetical protein
MRSAEIGRTVSKTTYLQDTDLIMIGVAELFDSNFFILLVRSDNLNLYSLLVQQFVLLAPDKH